MALIGSVVNLNLNPEQRKGSHIRQQGLSKVLPIAQTEQIK